MAESSLRSRSIGWPLAALASALATVALLGSMFWARSAFQIRTLPERVMEWALLFVPLDAFERGLQQFGPQAKDLAFFGAIVGMSLLLYLLAFFVLWRGWSGWSILVLGLGLWLFAMGVVMPVTGGGFFASELFQNPRLVNASYLGSALAYATVLLAARWLGTRRRRLGARPLPGERASEAVTMPLERPAPPPSRRPLLAGLAGVIGSYLAVAWFGREGGTVRSDLPLATVKPRAEASPVAAPTVPLPPTSAPQGAVAPKPSPATAPTFVPAKPAAAVPTATPSAVPTATPVGLPVPAPPRQLSRDKDGSLTAAGRQPGELSELITSNESFYVVTKNAGGDPLLKPRDWRCVVDGEVSNPIQLDYATLRQLPAVEVVKTLECISNFTAQCELTSFGCELISTARWKGARLVDILDLAGGVKPSAVSFGILSADEFSSAIPLEAALDPETLVVYEMNGEVLPYEHGYPARVLVPGRYGFKSAKWIVALRPMSQAFADWYGQRNWNRQGVVKTMTRIDTPAPSAQLPPGEQRVAGIAYAGDRGVQLVELSPDGGRTWQPTSFVEPQAGRDAWVRWQTTVRLPPGGSLQLVARTTDGTGAIQTEVFSLPQPDGGSGRHSIEIRADA